MQGHWVSLSDSHRAWDWCFLEHSTSGSASCKHLQDLRSQRPVFTSQLYHLPVMLTPGKLNFVVPQFPHL